jgi:hypothetical protein
LVACGGFGVAGADALVGVGREPVGGVSGLLVASASVVTALAGTFLVCPVQDHTEAIDIVSMTASLPSSDDARYPFWSPDRLATVLAGSRD